MSVTLRHLVALTAAALPLLSASVAQAIEFGQSSTTGKSTLLLPMRTNGAFIGPIGYTLGLRFGQNVGDMLGPTPANPGLQEVGSFLLDADLALSYRYPLADIELAGRFNPTVGPFLGYRWLGALTGQAKGPTGLQQVLAGNAELAGVVSLAQLHGLHYGVSADSELPLGIRAFANAGLTTLTGGGWDNRRNSVTVTSGGRLATGLMTLPGVGAGASWSPFPGVTFSAGYDVLALPTGMRAQGSTLEPGLTWLRSWSLGVNVFGFRF